MTRPWTGMPAAEARRLASITGAPPVLRPSPSTTMPVTWRVALAARVPSTASPRWVATPRAWSRLVGASGSPVSPAIPEFGESSPRSIGVQPSAKV